jgi:transketolase
MEASIRRGGYVLSDMEGAQATLISTGSELELAIQAQAQLAQEGIATRVVSMPCSNVFDRQTDAYQETVIPLGLPTIAIEAAHPDFWRKYVGRTGFVVGMTTFGESAPAKDLYKYFDITAERVVKAVHRVVGQERVGQAPTLPGHIVPSSN